MNRYLLNLKKIEYVITNACTGNCKHCSEGEHKTTGISIDANIAVDVLRRVAEFYPIETVMTFGGEPLLHADTVCRIHTVASELGIKKRQIITNGYFSKNSQRIQSIAQSIHDSGANDILVSVDAFHAECIPIDYVREFASSLFRLGACVSTQPAWLVSREDDNEYNKITRELLCEFESIGIKQHDGNIVFPSGRALEFLADYFVGDDIPSDPYVEDPYDVQTISIAPDGSVLGGNIYEDDILDILESYDP